MTEEDGPAADCSDADCSDADCSDTGVVMDLARCGILAAEEQAHTGWCRAVQDIPHDVAVCPAADDVPTRSETMHLGYIVFCLFPTMSLATCVAWLPWLGDACFVATTDASAVRISWRPR
ncbi:MAG TPA: hypothetical protein VE684_18020 [Crenalkalicoccus sp.]|nr:hypothetical protein [Crenalkalicoccus sp.]